MKFAIAAIVKNEIDAIEEWIAYHRLLGADHFLMADNGSTDGTREYLLALSDMPWLTLLDVVTPPERPPQLIAYERLAAECPSSIPLLAFIDADEFILPMPTDEQCHAGLRAQMDTWLNRRFSDPDVSAVVMNWATFGSSGQRFKKEGLVIERFQQRSKETFIPNLHYKAIVKRDALVRMESPHQPVLSYGELVNASGETFDYYVSASRQLRKGLSKNLLWQGARVNHYIVKSVEEFVLKKSPRGSATQLGREKKAEYFESLDKNDEKDDLLAAHAAAVKAEMARLALHRHLVEQFGGIDSGHGLGHRIEKVLFRRKRDELPLPVREFHLDFPQREQAPLVQHSQFLLQGWLLLTPEMAAYQPQATIIIQLTSKCELRLPLDIERPDVMKHYGLEDDATDAQLCCGFKTWLSLSVARFDVSLELGGMRWPLDQVKVQRPDQKEDPADQVRHGEQGFLFLDADTNHGLYQHAGKLLLTDKGIAAWDAYLQDVTTAVARIGAQHRLILVPSKEAVLDHYIDVPKGELTPAEQVAHLSPYVAYPVPALKTLGDDSYFRTDTHWTHKGAMLALIDVLQQMGFDSEAMHQVFAEDRYKQHDYKGDLGNKCSPAVSQPVKVLVSFKYRDLVTYDNGLANHGHMVVIENPEALFDSKLLLYGASSSTMLFYFVARLFKRVVFAHTTGHWDNDVARQVAPDVILLQTNARFATVPPTADYSLKKTIRQKAQEAASDPQAVMEKRVVRESASDLAHLWQQWDRWLLDSLDLPDDFVPPVAD